MPARLVVATLTAAFVAVVALGCSLASAPLSPEEIVAAFSAENEDEARTFHMEWQGTMTTSSVGPDAPVGQLTTATLTGSFDFSGDDFAGSLTTGVGAGGSGPIASTTAYARVGGATFIRYAESGWQRSDGLGLPQPRFDPLLELTSLDVAYGAPETIDGQDLHRLRILDPTAALGRAMLSGSGEPARLTANSAEYLLYVDGHGVPVRANLSFDGRVSPGAPEDVTAPGIGYTLVFEYRFSAWGEEFFIRSPV